MKKTITLTLLLFSLFSFSQSGSLDTTFNTGTGADFQVNSIATQADGKILIGGGFTSYNGVTQNRITRLNTDGSLDTTFNPGTGANVRVLTIAIQADGKILIGGYFTSYNGVAQNYIARLNTNGTLDTTFNSGMGANSSVESIATQVDGKILIGGGFTSYNGVARNHIARLNADGSLDTTFNPGTGANNLVTSIAIQADGKILIGGWFTSYNGAARNYIARLNTNGNFDTAFNLGTGANGSIWSIAIQADGKILIGGAITTYNGVAQNNIARLNTNGILDTAFNLGTGANAGVDSIAIQADGKILFGGYFTSYNGVARNHISRLNLDGSLDTTFNSGTGANSTVLSFALQTDGKILIIGDFTSYNGVTQNYIARLNVNVLSKEDFLTEATIKVYPNPSSHSLFVSQKDKHSLIVKITDLNGKELFTKEISTNENIDISNYTNGMYLVEVIDKTTNQKNTYIIIKN